MTRGCWVVQLLLYALEEFSTTLQIFRSPKLLENFGGAQSLRRRLFEPMLLVPNPGLLLCCTAQIVGAIDRVRFGAFDVNVRIVEPAFVTKQPRQVVMNLKQHTVPVGRGRDFEGHLVLVNSFLRLALGSVYIAEDEEAPTNQIVFSPLNNLPLDRRYSSKVRPKAP